MSTPPAIAFLLCPSASLDADGVIEQARALGLALALAAEQPESGRPLVFEGPAGLTMLAMPIEAPHPDIAGLAVLPWSPRPEELAAHRAHIIVALLGLPPGARVQDPVLARLALAVGRSCEAIGLLLGGGICAHRLDLAGELLEGQAATRAPVELTVDLIVYVESPGRATVLTHGLPRYGREDFLITTTKAIGEAVSLAQVMTRWMVDEPDKELPTDDTVGRTEGEKLKVQRVPHPRGTGATVVRLDMD
jgi:hypothetical protein